MKYKQLFEFSNDSDRDDGDEPKTPWDREKAKSHSLMRAHGYNLVDANHTDSTWEHPEKGHSFYLTHPNAADWREGRKSTEWQHDNLHAGEDDDPALAGGNNRASLEKHLRGL